MLEYLFPKFWGKWHINKNEIIAVIDRYAGSNTIQQAGALHDAVAKSCAGLEILASLILGETIFGNAGKHIHKVLRCYKIPNHDLDPRQPLSHMHFADR